MSKWNEELVEALKHSIREVVIAVSWAAIVYLIIWVREDEAENKKMYEKQLDDANTQLTMYREMSSILSRDRDIIHVRDTVYVPMQHK